SPADCRGERVAARGPGARLKIRSRETRRMRKLSLDALAREQLELARGAHGRSASTVFGGHEHTLRQTVMAMVAGTGTGEHASPGEATLLVLRGRIRREAGSDS